LDLENGHLAYHHDNGTTPNDHFRYVWKQQNFYQHENIQWCRKHWNILSWSAASTFD
jgi:hypothetical protein